MHWVPWMKKRAIKYTWKACSINHITYLQAIFSWLSFKSRTESLEISTNNCSSTSLQFQGMYGNYYVVFRSHSYWPSSTFVYMLRFLRGQTSCLSTSKKNYQLSLLKAYHGLKTMSIVLISFCINQSFSRLFTGGLLFPYYF